MCNMFVIQIPQVGSRDLGLFPWGSMAPKKKTVPSPAAKGKAAAKAPASKDGAGKRSPEAEEVPSKGPPGKKAKVANSKGELVDVEDLSTRDIRPYTSGMLGFLKYRGNPEKNKSGEGLAEAQKALEASLCLFVLT